MAETPHFPTLNRSGHVAHGNRCLQGLPSSLVEMDSSRYVRDLDIDLFRRDAMQTLAVASDFLRTGRFRMALGFYCLGILDVYGLIDQKSTITDRESWRSWIWAQQAKGIYGSGFCPSPFAATQDSSTDANQPGEYGDFSTPNLIMTYAALQSLAILRDDFAALDREGLAKFVGSCQGEDGSFSTTPGAGDADLRMSYCAFVICTLLDDWSSVDVERALAFISRCRPRAGGTTYCALACIHLAPPTLSSPSAAARLTPSDRARTLRWLVQKQDSEGGFCGRTGKAADACYCFWCGASLHGFDALVDTTALAGFLSRCQYKFGGISKAPGEHPDPYHTYLSSATIAIYCSHPEVRATDPAWKLQPLDPLLNARQDTAQWAREHTPKPQSSS
ncbi:hypothetical protein EW146_g3509 [Bondarzewia mesenterica]|uniref:Prenyltransferase alpha-alpha toroid domain-containing protein n=1 Tax=Bondarzewia mesenterica TaxID=1095465 RepID=A0A4S4LZ63_9AGAM|nr:hypothetical protein EW146_g3509 [Bondarzewia mesenterica]